MAKATSQADFDAASVAFFREDPSRVEAVAHPIRIKVLRLAHHGEVSAKEAAAELSEPISKVSYHVRVLAEAGLIEKVRQTQRRGAIETHYRARISFDFDTDVWNSLDVDLRRRLTLASMEAVWADTAKSVDEGDFELDGSLFTHSHIQADAQGIDEVRKAAERFYQELVAIEVACHERRRADPELETTGTVVTLTFMKGERTRASHGPHFARHSGSVFPLVPETPYPEEPEA